MLMFFIKDLGLVFVFKLFAYVNVMKWYFVSFDVLCFDDFGETGVSSISTCTSTETFIFGFGFDCGVKLCFCLWFAMRLWFAFELCELVKEEFVFKFEILEDGFRVL